MYFGLHSLSCRAGMLTGARDSWVQRVCCQEVEREEFWSSACFLVSVWSRAPGTAHSPQGGLF